jgi:Pentapeptide repeats (8 copies)
MANEEHVALLAKGSEAWNAWRIDNQDILPDLSKAALRDAHLAGANLHEAELREADLRGAVALQAALEGAADLARTKKSSATNRAYGGDVAISGRCALSRA